MSKMQDHATLQAQMFSAEDFPARTCPLPASGRGIPVDKAVTLTVDRQQSASHNGSTVVAFDWQQDGASTENHTATLNTTRTQADSLRPGVRRLMPVECERLQGFPDNWTAGQSDATRYRQLGNAIAVPVAEWIGRRIVAAERP